MFFVRAIFVFGFRFLELLFSIGFGLGVIFPLGLISWSVNTILRSVASWRLSCHPSRNLRLSEHGLDNIWGYRVHGNSRMVLNVVVYDRQIDVEQYRKIFQEKVIECQVKGQLQYGKLQEKFVEFGGFYCWEQDSEFDLRNHVVAHVNHEGQEVMDEKGLMVLLSTLSNDMTSDHPQWQEVIVPAFKYDLRGHEEVKSLRILRFHHAYGDAGSWLLLYSHCMANGKIPYAVNPLKGYPVPPWHKILYYTSVVTFSASTFVRIFWQGMHFLPNRLRTECYSGKKFFAWDKIPVDTVKRIKTRTSTSIPAVVTSAIAAALIRFDTAFPNRDGFCRLPDVTDCAAVAAILPYPNLCLTNRFTIANLNTPTVRDLSRKSRLRLTHEAISALTKSPEPMVNFWAMSFFGRFPVAIQNWAMKWAGTSMIFSNLPGSSESFKLHGTEVEAGGAWIPLLTTAGLTISAAGYRNHIRFCGATDSAAMTKDQLTFFLETIVHELHELDVESGAKGEFV